MNFLAFTIIPGIIAFVLMRKEKQTLEEGQTDESKLSGNLFWYVLILDFLAPLIAQSVFYYGWKKQLPKKAATANSLGWLAILVWLGVIFGVPYVMMKMGMVV